MIQQCLSRYTMKYGGNRPFGRVFVRKIVATLQETSTQVLLFKFFNGRQSDYYQGFSFNSQFLREVLRKI